MAFTGKRERERGRVEERRLAYRATLLVHSGIIFEIHRVNARFQ